MAQRYGLFLTVMVVLATGVECRWNLWMSQAETGRMLGVPGELWYVRNGVVNGYALTFNLPLKINVTDIYFHWNSTSTEQPGLQYRMTVTVSNANAITSSSLSIPSTGRLPSRTSSFRVSLPCSGLVSAEVDVRIQVNVTSSLGNVTSVEIRRRKICLIGEGQLSQLPAVIDEDIGDVDEEDPEIESKNRVPVEETQGVASVVLMYAGLGCACVAVVLLVALMVACRRRCLSRGPTNDARGCQLESTTPDKRRLAALQDARLPSEREPMYTTCSDKLSRHTALSSQRFLCQDWTQQTGSSAVASAHHGPKWRSASRCTASTNRYEMASSPSSSSSVPVGVTISRTNITLRKLLMEGTHGLLYFASLSDNMPADVDDCGLIVKTVTEKATREDIEEMVRTASVLRGIKHANVKSVVTVCIEPALPPFLVYHFDNDCNLKIYLHLCKTTQLISFQQLVFIALQVSRGLQFLHRQHITHTDVATRNCVVDDQFRVRLTDNALTWTLFPLDYHLVHGVGRVPVRWLPAEALESHTYSSYTDVWAMGVTTWELATYGAMPYEEIETVEVPGHVRAGYRLAEPINCPHELYTIMASCWHDQPQERPDITVLTSRLHQFYGTLSQYA